MSVTHEIARLGASLAKAGSGVREFVLPSYHPERHYMRGPGPACAWRARKALERPASPRG